MSAAAPHNASLKGASINRLACLVRHWTWANEAKARFERELADGWEYDEDPPADHLFGSYYHWCALLCGPRAVSVLPALFLRSRTASTNKSVYQAVEWVRHGTANENVAPGPSLRTAHRRP